jgi:hypothetical protein
MDGKWPGRPQERREVPESVRDITGYKGIKVDIGGLSRIKPRNGFEMARKVIGRSGKCNRGPENARD